MIVIEIFALVLWVRYITYACRIFLNKFYSYSHFIYLHNNTEMAEMANTYCSHCIIVYEWGGGHT